MIINLIIIIWIQLNFLGLPLTLVSRAGITAWRIFHFKNLTKSLFVIAYNIDQDL